MQSARVRTSQCLPFEGHDHDTGTSYFVRYPKNGKQSRLAVGGTFMLTNTNELDWPG